MYTDKTGFPIEEHHVVLLGNHLYSVTGFNPQMTCSVQLANGCVRSQAESKELTVVRSIHVGEILR